MLKPNKRIVAAAADRVEEEFAAKFEASWRKSVEGIFEAGQVLIEAKKGLPHGSFQRFVRERLGLHPRIAERLMRIARSGLLNATDPSHLPASVTALDALCPLADFVDILVAEGRISRNMTEEDVRRLRRGPEVVQEEPPLAEPIYDRMPELFRARQWSQLIQYAGESMARAAEGYRYNYGAWEDIEIEPRALRSLREGLAAIEPLLLKAGWRRADA